MTDEDNYISLAQAAKNCPYSQEYLALRARQGKLKAVKFGRNWKTRIDWVQEYTVGVKEYNVKIVEAKKADCVLEDRTSPPPDNLPVEDIKRLRLALGCLALFSGIFLFSSVALVSVDLVKNYSFTGIADSISRHVAVVSGAVVAIGQENFPDAWSLLEEGGQWLNKSYLTARIFIEELDGSFSDILGGCRRALDNFFSR
jgi:hypothetical protein